MVLTRGWLMTSSIFKRVTVDKMLYKKCYKILVLLLVWVSLCAGNEITITLYKGKCYMNNLSISSHYGRIKKEPALHFRYQDGVLVSGRRSIVPVMNGVGNWYSRHCPMGIEKVRCQKWLVIPSINMWGAGESGLQGEGVSGGKTKIARQQRVPLWGLAQCLSTNQYQSTSIFSQLVKLLQQWTTSPSCDKSMHIMLGKPNWILATKHCNP